LFAQKTIDRYLPKRLTCTASCYFLVPSNSRYYNYPSEMEDALHAILENHLSVLKVTAQQVVLQYF
ncbi:MAG: hypothetical protein V7K14_22415, partial [Nostoc sp.]